jgi:hypothetical protein
MSARYMLGATSSTSVGQVRTCRLLARGRIRLCRGVSHALASEVERGNWALKFDQYVEGVCVSDPQRVGELRPNDSAAHYGGSCAAFCPRVDLTHTNLAVA